MRRAGSLFSPTAHAALASSVAQSPHGWHLPTIAALRRAACSAQAATAATQAGRAAHAPSRMRSSIMPPLHDPRATHFRMEWRQLTMRSSSAESSMSGTVLGAASRRGARTKVQSHVHLQHCAGQVLLVGQTVQGSGHSSRQRGRACCRTGWQTHTRMGLPSTRGSCVHACSSARASASRPGSAESTTKIAPCT